MLIAWTTVATRAEADALAAGVIAVNLAACVQIEGPIVSHYRWQGKLEQAQEYRLSFKFLPAQLLALEAHVLRHHPYTTPEWIVVRAEHVGEKYLSWAQANSSPLPL
jgi:periplasmic divalent cation tolerance protein